MAVRTVIPANVGEPADLVIVLVKSFHTAEAVSQAIGLDGPDTSVLSLQNGLGHEEVLTGLIGRDRVIAGKTYVGGVALGPGQVIASVAAKETIGGELDGRITPRIERIAATFEAAGLKFVVSRSIMGAMWDKLLINIATGDRPIDKFGLHLALRFAFHLIWRETKNPFMVSGMGMAIFLRTLYRIVTLALECPSVIAQLADLPELRTTPPTVEFHKAPLFPSAP